MTRFDPLHDREAAAAALREDIERLAPGAVMVRVISRPGVGATHATAVAYAVAYRVDRTPIIPSPRDMAALVRRITAARPAVDWTVAHDFYVGTGQPCRSPHGAELGAWPLGHQTFGPRRPFVPAPIETETTDA